MARRRETELYPPIKRFLEGQGYEVKSEVGDCDVVAVRDGEEPVLVELKTSFNLPLVLQGVRRQAISDAVYLAFAASPVKTSMWRRQRRDILKLCRRLGLGLLVVRMDETMHQAMRWWKYSSTRRRIGRARPSGAGPCCYRSSSAA